MTALELYEQYMEDVIEENPIERLRFFLSLCLTGQDWLDVEPFIEEVVQQLSSANEQHEKTMHQMFNKDLSPDDIMRLYPRMVACVAPLIEACKNTKEGIHALRLWDKYRGIPLDSSEDGMTAE